MNSFSNYHGANRNYSNPVISRPALGYPEYCSICYGKSALNGTLIHPEIFELWLTVPKCKIIVIFLSEYEMCNQNIPKYIKNI